MERIWLGLFVAVGLAVGLGSEAIAQPAGRQLYVKYYPSKVSQHAGGYAKERTLEDAAALVNGILDPNALPQNVEIAVTDCGQVNAFWQPSTKRILFCYEMLDALLATSRNITDDKGQSFYQMAHFILLHEVGHMFQDLLKRGGLGNREGEADYFAAIVAISAGDDGAAMAAKGAYLFGSWARNEKWRFNDEHPPSIERAYDVMCLVYGSAPRTNAGIGQQLGKDRAARCVGDYPRTFQAWKEHLRPVLVGGSRR